MWKQDFPPLQDLVNHVFDRGGGVKNLPSEGAPTIFLAHTYKVNTRTTKSYKSDHIFNVVGGGSGRSAKL